MRLPALGWQPTIITLGPAGPLHRSSRLAEARVPVVSLVCRRRRDYLLAIPRLAALLARAELVHAHLFDGTLLSTIAAAVVRRPVVITRHEGPLLARRAPGGGLKRRLYHCIDSAILRNAAAVIGPSDAVFAEVVALGAVPARVHKILLGVDMDRLSRVDGDAARHLRAQVAPRSSFVTLAVGRLSWEKQLDVLLGAWHMVAAVHPDAMLLVVGDGPERGRLERQAVQASIGNSVSFLGQRDDVPELMLAADVVAHASAIESTGLVLLEALALGRPLISTPVGIVNEYLVDGVHCQVVPQADPAALAVALLQVASDASAAARLAEAGRAAVMERSGIDAMVAAYARIYDTVTRRHR